VPHSSEHGPTSPWHAPTARLSSAVIEAAAAARLPSLVTTDSRLGAPRAVASRAARARATSRLREAMLVAVMEC